jgi:SAM-dependent methyltransferase
MTEVAYTGIENLEVMKEAKNYNRYLALLIERQLRPHDKVLDFGAGAGTFALPLMKRGVDVVAVEPDPVLGALLRQEAVPTVAGLEEIPDGSIDLIYTLNVLEHIADDRAAVGALAGKLKRGGRLLVYVPAFQILFSAMDRMVGHHRRYRREPLVEILALAGLDVHKAAYIDSLGFAATLLYRLIGGDRGEINRAALTMYDRVVFPVSRIIDVALHPWVGKNLLVLAGKP